MGDVNRMNAEQLRAYITQLQTEGHRVTTQLDEANTRATAAAEAADEATAAAGEAERLRLAAEARNDGGGPSAQDWRDLINAMRAPRQTTFVNAVNPMTQVLYKDYGVVAGQMDTKDVKLPAGFSGKRWDARPFVHRLEAVFALCPNKYRLARTRILAACSVIAIQPAATWALTISKAVAHEDDTGGYYLDDWEDFVKKFTESYGIPNEKEDAQNRIQKLYQGESPFESYIAEFKRLQMIGEIPDTMALIFFKRGLSKRLYDAVYTLPTPPRTLLGWVEHCREKERQHYEQRDFAKSHRAFQPGSYSHYSHAQGKTPHHPFARKDPDAMDVDQVRQAGRRPGKQVKPTSKPRSQTRPPVRNQRVANVEATPTSSSSRPSIICYNCGREGHFKRDCRVTKIQQLSQEERDVLAEYAFNLPRGPQEDEDEEDHEGSISQVPEQDEEEEELLLVHDEEDEQDFPQDSV